MVRMIRFFNSAWDASQRCAKPIGCEGSPIEILYCISQFGRCGRSGPFTLRARYWLDSNQLRESSSIGKVKDVEQITFIPYPLTCQWKMKYRSERRHIVVELASLDVKCVVKRIFLPRVSLAAIRRGSSLTWQSLIIPNIYSSRTISSAHAFTLAS